MANTINEFYGNKDSQDSITARLDRAINSNISDRAFMDKIWKEILGIFNSTIEKTIPYEEKSIGSLQTEDLKKLEHRTYKYYTEMKDVKRLRRLINYSKE